jgi:hypothetical protein
MELISVALGVFILNLSFGYWRANEKKFSFRWFLSIHAPVPFVVLLRLVAGVGWHPATFPFLIGAFFSGQYVGGWLYHRRQYLHKTPLTACLVWDLVKGRAAARLGG